jgi:ribosomal protein S18 acetylase RimI-like enzyme
LVTIAGYYNNLFVGVVGCRPERRADGKQRLYVAVLAVLPAYRGLGIGTKMLQSVLDELPKHEEYVEVYLHVHTPNTRAVALYERLGFQNVGVIKGYYTAAELTPPDCVLLRFTVGDAAPTVDLEHGGLGAPVPVVPTTAAAASSS